jgi:hypothetical protein
MPLVSIRRGCGIDEEGVLETSITYSSIGCWLVDGRDSKETTVLDNEGIPVRDCWRLSSIVDNGIFTRVVEVVVVVILVEVLVVPVTSISKVPLNTVYPATMRRVWNQFKLEGMQLEPSQ